MMKREQVFEVIKKERKFKNGDCTGRWANMKPKCFGIGSLIVLAKQGNLEMYEPSTG